MCDVMQQKKLQASVIFWSHIQHLRIVSYHVQAAQQQNE